MFATAVPLERASHEGIRLVARLVLDERARPDWTPEIRAMVSDASKRSWVHLVYEGRWDGYQKKKKSFEFTPEAFDTIVANFDAQANEVVFDFEHGTEFAAPGDPVPAAGWVHAVARQGDSLFAYVEWSDRASSMIEAGEYRFCSVVVDFHAVDRKSGDEIGPRLVSVGLTNVPFIDGQEPIRLSARTRSTPRSTTSMPVTKKSRIALTAGAKALLAQIAGLLKVDLSEGDDVYFKVMDALGALQGAAKVEDMLVSAPAGGAVPALADRRINKAHVLVVLAESGTDKISREKLIEELEKLDGEEFAPSQIAALVEAIVKMQQAQAPAKPGSDKPEPAKDAAATAASQAAGDAGGTPPVAASAVVPPAGAAPVTAATPPPPGGTAPAELPPEAAASISSKLLEATGLPDAAALVAFIEANRDALQTMAAGIPADGSQADAGGAAMSDRGTRAILAQLRGLSAENVELRSFKRKHEEAEAARVLSERNASADRFADELVASGKVLDVARAEWREMHFESPKKAVALSTHLQPIVRTDRIAAGKDPNAPNGAGAGSSASTVALSDADAEKLIASFDAESKATFDTLLGMRIHSRAECARITATEIEKRRARA